MSPVRQSGVRAHNLALVLRTVANSADPLSRAAVAGATGLTATRLATAAITAETFGSLLGRAAGGAVTSLAGLVPAYLMFAVFLAAAALGATRTGR